MYLTPAQARRLHYVQEKLREATSAFQHDRLIEAIAEIYREARESNDADESRPSRPQV